MAKTDFFHPNDTQPRTLALGVWTADVKQKPEFYFQEFYQLIKTANIKLVLSEDMKLREINRTHFFGQGKLDELAEIVEKNNIEEIVISALLNPIQERNLENFLDCRVYGRAELIIEIFRQSAHSAEGKIQVEMAYLDHLKTRLTGRGRELSQQEGGIGSKGPGETQKEILRRIYADKLRQAKKKLDHLAKSRETQRKQRMASGVPRISLVGYTNAGKSSLLNVLTKSDILAEDKLFATLDTTTREMFLESISTRVLLSDTVGFINQLPHQLIEAFRSTLDELRYAHLLLHVIDSSNPDWTTQVGVVNDTLAELSISTPVLHVFNKIDLIDEEQLPELKELARNHYPSVFIHTRSKDGAKELIAFIETFVAGLRSASQEA